jgi:2-C-methyl-D-erythritol 4-phosphate cytidylyltransferase
VNPRVAAVVLAGGSGSRLEGEVNKVYLKVSSRELLGYSLLTMAEHEWVTDLVVVSRAQDRDRLDRLLLELRLALPLRLVDGGATRHQSEWAALESVAGLIEDNKIDLVAIHDGARPFITSELLASCLVAAKVHGGGVPALALQSNTYEMDADRRMVPMDVGSLVRVQTPQVFRATRLLDAYRAAAKAGFDGVDTSETVERFSDLTVAVVPGDERNIKITVASDLSLAEAHLTETDHDRNE